MKVQVISRSFYEDAYLNFFIKYYLNLGFDRILILKADKYELSDYSLSDDIKKIIDTTDQKVLIKYVDNLGNDIYREYDNFKYYVDKNYDWTLHVDADELLVYDMNKYKYVHDYINDYNKIMNDNINQIKLRWLCINKLDDNWNYLNKKIKNDELNDIHICDNLSKKNGSKKDINLGVNKYSLYNYLLHYKLESYSYVKSIAKTNKIINKKDNLNAHYFLVENKNNNSIVIDNKIIKNKHNNYSYNILLDKDKNYSNGFILHINTRSYSNTLTKCLVTKLRKNKQITSLDEFRKFINNINIDNLNDDEINKIKSKYCYFLNRKYIFPMKIKKFHEDNKLYINRNIYINQLKTLIKNNKNLLLNEYFIDKDKEDYILKNLCNDKNINYNNIKKIINLF